MAGLVVPGRERGAGREEPQRELSREALLAHHVPADVVAAAVAGEVGSLGVERPVDRAVGEVEEERARRVVRARSSFRYRIAWSVMSSVK